MNWIADKVAFYLPVVIPLFLTVISVLAGILTKRIKFAVGDLLKIHSDVVLGLFSFVIWALVQYQQTGRVQLNAQVELDFVRVVLLLFANIVLLIAGYILLNINWTGRHLPMLGSAATHSENVANGALLLVTVYAVFAPIQLAHASDPARNAQVYAVTVPYSDVSIARNVGMSRWNGRRLCDIQTVVAPDAATASAQALQLFGAGGHTYQLFDRAGLATVSVDTALIHATRLDVRGVHPVK